MRDHALIGLMIYSFARVEAAVSSGTSDGPLFRSADWHYGSLNRTPLHRVNAWQMVQRRAKAAGLETHVCNHSFRATGITVYLSNGG